MAKVLATVVSARTSCSGPPPAALSVKFVCSGAVITVRFLLSAKTTRYSPGAISIPLGNVHCDAPCVSFQLVSVTFAAVFVFHTSIHGWKVASSSFSPVVFTGRNSVMRTSCANAPDITRRRMKSARNMNGGGAAEYAAVRTIKAGIARKRCRDRSRSERWMASLRAPCASHARQRHFEKMGLRRWLGMARGATPSTAQASPNPASARVGAGFSTAPRRAWRGARGWARRAGSVRGLPAVRRRCGSGRRDRCAGL